MLTRRELAFSTAIFATSPWIGAQPSGAVVGDDGLHVQDWFVQSFLDMAEDLAEAADGGRHFAVIWEQPGCPFCEKTHEINFAREDVRSYIADNFSVLQLNLVGSREVTDFDGQADEERSMARRWAINFTPTIQFFPADSNAIAGQGARQAEIARIQGYLPPFYFYHFFKWVRTGRHTEMGFQRYANDAVKALPTGTTPQTWSAG